jgi:long-chain acyl-CoA synthetase
MAREAQPHTDLGRWPNLPTLFFDQVDRLGDRPFLWKKRDGVYRALSWGDTAARVTPLARGLSDLGVKPGDRVALVSENRPAWMVADLAIMALGAITVPAYTTNTVDDHRHVLSDSGSVGVIVSTAALARKVIEAAADCPQVRFVACMDVPEDAAPRAGLSVLALDDVIDTGRKGRANIVEKARTWAREDTACIIYTSGTGGTPKGVMLSHGAILHNAEAAIDVVRPLGLERNVFLSFLPLSHSYEHTAGQFVPMAIEAEIYYADGIETLLTNLAEARPTLMTAVPRLYESMHQRILRNIEKEGGLKKALFLKAVAIGTKRYEGRTLNPIEWALDALLDRLVREKVRGRFGGRLKALISGGAPLPPELGTFFTALGLRLLQGYGQTESAPLISVNPADGYKMHTVGKPVAGVEVRIAEDGEICVRGENVMQGYWNQPDATAETVVDGWLHTGDIGAFDDDGHLMITDRKKDIIVNSGGDNLAPQRVEGIICLEPEFAQAAVFGDRQPHLVGVVVPDADWLKDWAKANGKSADLAALRDDPDLKHALSEAMRRANAKLSTIEKVRRFVVADTPFTIDDGSMTPTMKLRRHVVRERWGDTLAQLYEKGAAVPGACSGS